MGFDQFRNRTRWAVAAVMAQARQALRVPVVRPSRQLDLVELEERVLMNAVPAAVIVQNLEPQPMIAVEIEPAVISDLQAAQPPVDAPQSALIDPDAIEFTVVSNGSPGFASDVQAVDTQTSREFSAITELAFVDASATDHEQLVADILQQREAGRRIDVVVLDSNRDGVEQIRDALARYEGLDAIHLVTHGSPGQLKLGSTWLSLDTLDGYAGDIAQWGGALGSQGDLLLYGCELGASESGVALMNSLATLTGADVAASSNNTGTALLGADWNLELAVGEVELGTAFTSSLQANWFGLLATNLPPNAIDDGGVGFTTTEDTTLVTGNVTANDSDPDAGDLFTVTSLDTAGTLGLVADNGDGTLTYNPNGQFNSLGVGQQATDTFTYTITDSNGAFATATVSITIDGRNDAPSIGNATLGSVSNGSLNPSGDTVANLFGGTFADIDNAASFRGVAVIANSINTTQGEWQYSSNGVNWFAIGTVNDGSSALTVGATSRLRFVPALGFVGAPTGLQVRAIDDSYSGQFSTTSSGESRVLIDSSLRGGTASISASIGTLSTSITPVGSVAQFLFSTANDVTSAGTPGVTSWQSGEVLTFGDSGFATGTNTSGTFASLQNFGSSLNIDAVYYVSRSITVGGGSNTFNLQTGDILLSTAAPATFFNLIVPVNVDKDDVFVFRPDALGLLTGTYYKLLDNFGTVHGGGETRSISLVEQDTVVGDTTLLAGSFLFTRDGAAQANDVRVFQPTGVGSGTTGGTVQVLIEGDQVGIDTHITGLNLLTAPTSLGGRTYDAGTLLVNVDASDVVGTNGVAVENADVFALNASTTTLGSGTATATAALVFDGSDVGLDQMSESLDAIAILPSSSAPAIALSSAPATFTEGGAAVQIDSGALVSDADSANVDTGTLTVQVTAGATVDDRLSIRDDGLLGISVTGNDIYSLLSRIGSFTGGTGTTPLQITFTASATPALVQATLRNVVFSNISVAPDQTTRTVAFRLTDGDGGVSNVAIKAVNVVGINSPPTVSATATAATLEDNALSYSHTALLALIGANDIDHPVSSLTITISNVTNGSFSMTGGSGGVGTTFTFTPNFNSLTSMTFNYSIQDGLSSSSTGAGTINITSLNDAPVLTLSGNVSVNEDSGSTVIANYAAATPGGGADESAQTVTFNVSSTNAALFAVAPTIDSSGRLTFTLNPDSNGSSTVSVAASDNGGTSNGGSNTSTAQTFVITVVPQNDSPTASNATFSTVENTANGSVVGTVAAADIDGDVLTFSIVSGNTNGAFAINSATGEITVANSAALDFETQPSFNLSIEARDPSNAVAAASVAINLLNANEAPSVSGFTTTLAENSAFGTTIGTVTAIDQDGDTLSFSIVSGNSNGAFSINSSTGEIRVANSAALDFETQSTFNLSINVNDGFGGSSNAAVTVNLTNQNEAPAVTGFATSLAENSANNTVVGSVSGTDPDGDALTYALSSGNVGNAFSINSTTGIIRVANTAALDFESQSLFNLVVTVSDGNGLTGTTAVTVSLINQNETPVASGFTTALPENSSNGTVVGSPSATDPDGDPLTWSILSGNSSGAFVINATTGAVTVANSASLNFEVTQQFTLMVQARDGGGLTSSTAVTINLTDVNEAPVVVSPHGNSSGDFSVAEDTLNGTVVATLTATDPDPGDVLTWSLTSGDPDQIFELDPQTGRLTVINAAALDAVAQPQMQLTIEVSDQIGLTHTVTVYVDVTAETPVVVLPLSTLSPQRLAPVLTSQAAAETNDTSNETSDTATEESPTAVMQAAQGPASTPITAPESTAEQPATSLLNLSNSATGEALGPIGLPQVAELRPTARLGSASISAAISMSSTNGAFRDSLQTARASLRFEGEDLSYVVDTRFLQGLQDVEKSLAFDAPAKQLAIGTAVATSAGLSVGYIVWMIRGGYLLASVLSTVPTWQYVDPLPVLSALDGDDEDDESLESLVETAEEDALAAT